MKKAKKIAKMKEPVIKCGWLDYCTKDAVATFPHSTRGDVPVCERCLDFNQRLAKVLAS